MGKRVMAIQYALLSLGTGVISSSQVHNMFHAMHTCIYSIYASVRLRASGRARAHVFRIYMLYVYGIRRHTRCLLALFNLTYIAMMCLFIRSIFL